MSLRILLASCVCLLLAGSPHAQRPAASSARAASANNARIAGKVIAADTGAPLAGARVVLEAMSLTSTSVSTPTRTATTDAAGEFEFPGLPAGDYQLAATKTGFLFRTPSRPAVGGALLTVRDRQVLQAPDIAMFRGGAINGRIVDDYGEPLARVPVHARRYQYASDGNRAAVAIGISDVTDDLGQFRLYRLPPGDYLVLAASAVGPGDPINPFSPILSSDIAPTYYPGTINAAEAQVVSLAAGAEASVQFATQAPILVRVLGSVVTSAGTPASGQRIMLRSGAADWVALRNGGIVPSDGRFVFNRVAPGSYWIDVTSPSPDGESETASVPISVSTEELSDVTIVTHRGATIRGQVEFEGRSPRPATFRLKAASTESAGLSLVRRSPEARPADDGSFELTGVTGRVVLVSDNEGWIVTSAMIDGDEKADEPFDPAGRDVVTGVRVRVTDRQGAVAGHVTDDRNRPLRDHVAVVMRTDQTGLGRDRIRVARTEGDGRFRLDGLRSGAYVAGVVEELEQNYQFSPDFQQRLRLYGDRFSIAEGEAVNLELKLTSGLP